MGELQLAIIFFTAVSPFIGITVIGLSPAIYGIYFILAIGGIVIGSLVSSRIVAYLDSKKTIFIGLLIAGIGILIMTVFFYFDWVCEWTLFLPIGIHFFGIALIYSSAAVLSTVHISDKSNGSAILSFINLSLAALAVNIVSLLDAPIFLPLSLLLLVCLMVLPWKKINYDSQPLVL